MYMNCFLATYISFVAFNVISKPKPHPPLFTKFGPPNLSNIPQYQRDGMLSSDLVLSFPSRLFNWMILP